MADKLRRKKIAVYQTKPEYPSLHIMVTDNARYFEKRIVLDTVDEAIERIRQWLERTMIDDNKRDQANDSVPSRSNSNRRDTSAKRNNDI